jgi:ABC-type multidrug transport system fused ATPase/permease subunit
MDFKLNIPFKVYLRPGERLILLGKNKSGKTSFFKVFLGQMLPRNGMFRYGGTIGYCPQVYFLQKMDAIRDNILFGSDYDVDRLNAAYDFVGLSDHLNNLEFYDEHFLSEVIAALHTSCRQRIPLARAVYYNPDIYLLDDIFTAFDTQSARNILKNFE